MKSLALERKKIKQRILNMSCNQDPNIFSYKNVNLQINNTTLIDDINSLYDEFGNTIISITGKKDLKVEVLSNKEDISFKILFGKIDNMLKESSKKDFLFLEDSNIIIYIKQII